MSSREPTDKVTDRSVPGPIDEGVVPGEPEPERVISDPETLRAISDPLRIRILETMVQRTDPPWSVRELAAVLDVPPTRLYHHVDLLLERDLIRIAERRLVSGIVETRYRIAALSLRLDRRLFAPDHPERLVAFHHLLTMMFDDSRDEIVRALRSGLIDPAEDAAPARRHLLAKGLARVTPDRAEELRRRLGEVLADYQDAPDTGDDALTVGILLAVYPTTSPAPEEGRRDVTSREPPDA